MGRPRLTITLRLILHPRLASHLEPPR
jgi:hypothetical protein